MRTRNGARLSGGDLGADPVAVTLVSSQVNIAAYAVLAEEKTCWICGLPGTDADR